VKFEVHPEVRKASTLPSEFYTDPSVFEASRESIFARSWQFVGRIDAVAVPGQATPITLLEGCLDEPVLFTRDRDDQMYCLSNVCTHRGNILCEGSTHGNSLRCRYHGRRFAMDGKMLSMPEFDGVEGFPSPADDLPKVPFGSWRDFLFAGVKPSGTLEDYLSDVQARVGWLPIEEFVPAPERSRDYLVHGHWALYIDNYLEGFHIPYIHADLNATLDYGTYRTELMTYGNLQLGTAADAEEAFDLPESSPDHGTRIAAYYFWMFPNLMLNFYPWGLSVNVVRPLGPALTKVSFIPFVWKPEKLAQGAGAALDRVEREDEAVVELVQRGLRSRFYSQGRYSPEREKGVHQFHRMIADHLNQA